MVGSVFFGYSSVYSGDKAIADFREAITGRRAQTGLETRLGMLGVSRSNINDIDSTVGTVFAAPGLYQLGKAGMLALNKYGIFSRPGVYELNPQKIRFTQPTVSPYFQNGARVDELIEDLKAGTITANDLPPIRVVKYEGDLYALDNRRLLAYSYAKLEKITVEVVSLKNPNISEEFYNKFNPIDNLGNMIVSARRIERETALDLLEEHSKIRIRSYGK